MKLRLGLIPLLQQIGVRGALHKPLWGLGRSPSQINFGEFQNKNEGLVHFYCVIDMMKNFTKFSIEGGMHACNNFLTNLKANFAHTCSRPVEHASIELIKMYQVLKTVGSEQSFELHACPCCRHSPSGTYFLNVNVTPSGNNNRLIS